MDIICGKVIIGIIVLSKWVLSYSEWVRDRTLYFLLFMFSYAPILFNFENRRFSFVFPSVGKNLQFCFKTEGFLNHKTFRKASIFFWNRRFSKNQRYLTLFGSILFLLRMRNIVWWPCNILRLSIQYIFYLLLSALLRSNRFLLTY